MSFILHVLLQNYPELEKAMFRHGPKSIPNELI